jgi:hypothetical protein
MGFYSNLTTGLLIYSQKELVVEALRIIVGTTTRLCVTGLLSGSQYLVNRLFYPEDPEKEKENKTKTYL